MAKKLNLREAKHIKRAGTLPTFAAAWGHMAVCRLLAAGQGSTTIPPPQTWSENLLLVV